MEKIFRKQNNLKYISFIRLLAENNSKNKKYFSGLGLCSLDIAMILAPLITYLFQIVKFYKTKSSKGFSKLVCLLFFLGNIFRIFFWYGKRFKNALLYQSIGIVIFQIILIHLCIKFKGDSFKELQTYLPELKIKKERTQIIQNKNFIYFQKYFKAKFYSKPYKIKFLQLFLCTKTFNRKFFWNWEEEIEYYKFMGLSIVLLSLLCSIFKDYQFFFQIIGILSAFFETSICVPQIISNFRSKYTKNISFMMILCWFFGDSFRLFYNIKYLAPAQLIIGISIQLILDIVVLFQLIIYRKNNLNYKIKNNENKVQIEEINQLMKSIDEANVDK